MVLQSNSNRSLIQAADFPLQPRICEHQFTDLDLFKKRYFKNHKIAYAVALCGALALLASLSYMLHQFGLTFQFGYTESEVSLGLLGQPVGTIIWITSILVFASYPFLTFSARRSRLILYVHLLFPATILLWLLWQDLFGVFFANLILAYFLMVCHSMKTIGIPSRLSIMIFLSTLFALIIVIETFAMIAVAIYPAHVLSLFSLQNDVGVLAVARFSLNLFGLFDFATLALLLLLILMGFVFCFFGYNQQSFVSNGHRMGFGTAAAVVGIWILSIVSAVLPYFYVRPPVGIDAAWYVRAVDTLTRGRSLTSLFISEPRAVYILILYAIKLVVGETAYALVVGVAILSGLASLANYWLAWKVFYRRDVALLAGAMSSLAP